MFRAVTYLSGRPGFNSFSLASWHIVSAALSVRPCDTLEGVGSGLLCFALLAPRLFPNRCSSGDFYSLFSFSFFVWPSWCPWVKPKALSMEGVMCFGPVPIVLVTWSPKHDRLRSSSFSAFCADGPFLEESISIVRCNLLCMLQRLPYQLKPAAQC